MASNRPAGQPPGAGAAAGGIARDRADAAARLRTLTDRELEVLAVLATGATARAVGDELGIKEATVKQHLRSVYLKLGAANRVQATRCYLLAQESIPAVENAATRRRRPRG